MSHAANGNTSTWAASRGLETAAGLPLPHASRGHVQPGATPMRVTGTRLQSLGTWMAGFITAEHRCEPPEMRAWQCVPTPVATALPAVHYRCGECGQVWRASDGGDGKSRTGTA
jgi:hypothetical protein